MSMYILFRAKDDPEHHWHLHKFNGLTGHVGYYEEYEVDGVLYHRYWPMVAVASWTGHVVCRSRDVYIFDEDEEAVIADESMGEGDDSAFSVAATFVSVAAWDPEDRRPPLYREEHCIGSYPLSHGPIPYEGKAQEATAEVLHRGGEYQEVYANEFEPETEEAVE